MARRQGKAGRTSGPTHQVASVRRRVTQPTPGVGNQPPLRLEPDRSRSRAVLRGGLGEKKGSTDGAPCGHHQSRATPGCTGRFLHSSDSNHRLPSGAVRTVEKIPMTDLEKVLSAARTSYA